MGLGTHDACVCDFTSITTRNNRFKTINLPRILALLCEIHTKTRFKSKDILTLCISVVKLGFELIIYLIKWGIIGILFNVHNRSDLEWLNIDQPWENQVEARWEEKTEVVIQNRGKILNWALAWFFARHSTIANFCLLGFWILMSFHQVSNLFDLIFAPLCAWLLEYYIYGCFLWL